MCWHAIVGRIAGATRGLVAAIGLAVVLSAGCPAYQALALETAAPITLENPDDDLLLTDPGARLPRLFTMPPFPFHAQDRETLSSIVDDDVSEELLGTTKSSFDGATGNRARLESGLTYALALTAAGKEAEAIAILTQLSSTKGEAIAEIVLGLVYYRQGQFDEARRSLETGFSRLKHSRETAMLQRHLVAQILSTAKRPKEYADYVAMAPAGDFEIEFPFNAYPQGPEWDYVRVAHFLATTKHYEVLWNQRSSDRLEKGVYAQFFMLQAENSGKDWEKYALYSKMFGEVALAHGHSVVGEFYVSLAILTLAAEGITFEKSDGAMELMLLQLKLQSADPRLVENVKSGIDRLESYADVLKEGDLLQSIFLRVRIAEALRRPDYSQTATEILERIAEELDEIRGNAAAPDERRLEAKAIRYHIGLNLVRAYREVANFWKLDTELRLIAELGKELETKTTDFDGTRRHLWHMEAERLQVLNLLDRPETEAEFATFISGLRDVVDIFAGDADDIIDAFTDAEKQTEESDKPVGDVQLLSEPTLTTYGRLLARVGKAEQAFDVLRRARMLQLQKDGGCGSEAQPVLAAELAELAFRLGDQESFNSYLQSETQLCADLFSRTNVLRAKTLVIYARFLAETGDFYAAEYALQRARLIYASRLPYLTDLTLRSDLALAGIYARTGRAERAFDLINGIRSALRTTKLKESDRSELISGCLEVLSSNALFENRRAADLSFGFVQLARSGETASAYDRLIKRVASGKNEGSNRDLRVARETALSLRLIESQISDAFFSSDATAMNIKARRDLLLANRDRAEQKLRAELGLSKEKFDALVDRAEPDTRKPAEIAAALGTNDIVVELFPLESRLLVLRLDASGELSMRKVEVSQIELSQRIAALRQSVEIDLTKKGPRPFDTSTAHWLFTHTLESISADFDRAGVIYVVASGDLATIPLPALLTGPGPEKLGLDLRGLPFLVKRKAATVLLPSASALVHAGPASEARTGPLRALIVTANPQVEGRLEKICGVALPDGSISETALGVISAAARCSIGQLEDLSNASLLSVIAQGSPLFDQDRPVTVDQTTATERHVKSLDMSPFNLIAFMAHGVSPDRQLGLFEAGLVLKLPNDPTENDDGLLTTSEIALLDLNADLVMLLGCETATGLPGDTETLTGFGRAFLEAGARSLIVTNWQVRAGTLPIFARAVFDNLAAGHNKAEAVHQATSMFLDRDRVRLDKWTHPFYWAPYTFIGKAN